MKKEILFLMIGLLILGACANQVSVEDTQSKVERIVDVPANMEVELDWRNSPLKDVNTGKEFKISDFKGRTILLESFAVWCPTCTRQQREIHNVKNEIPDLITITLDTDPNEDEGLVREHTRKNNFDGIYAISPVEVTKSLIFEFGNSFVFAPQAPVVLICKDGETRFLKSGVKTSSELKIEIERGC